MRWWGVIWIGLFLCFGWFRILPTYSTVGLLSLLAQSWPPVTPVIKHHIIIYIYKTKYLPPAPTTDFNNFLSLTKKPILPYSFSAPRNPTQPRFNHGTPQVSTSQWYSTWTRPFTQSTPRRWPFPRWWRRRLWGLLCRTRHRLRGISDTEANILFLSLSVPELLHSCFLLIQ